MSISDVASPLSSLGSRMGLPSEVGIGSVHGSDSTILAREDRAQAPRARPSACDLQHCVRLCIFNVGSTTVDEAWSVLSGILTPSEYGQIAKLQRITNASSHPRIDMWVRKDLGASLVRIIREATKGRSPSFVKSISESADRDNYRHEVCSGWRLAIWQSWQDRQAQSTPQLNATNEMAPPPTGLKFATLNVNGFNSKREQVWEFLREQHITVCALQETLVSCSQFPVKAPGFKSYVREWQEGFRGQAVLVSTLLPSYQVPHGKEKLDGYQYLIHVRIPSLPGFTPPRSLHFVGVYLPSGGNMRSLRTKGFLAVCDLYEKISRKESDAFVVCMGDWNVSEELLIRRLKTSHLHYLRPVGSSVSRFPTRGSSSSLDHVVASPIGGALLRRPRVERSVCLSDHRPVVVAMGAISPGNDCATSPAPILRLNKRELARRSFDFVNDNRWLAVAELNVPDLPSLSEASSLISETLMDVGSSTGVYKEVHPAPRKAYLPKRLKLLLRKYRQLSSKVAFELHTHWGGPLLDSKLKSAYETARSSFRKEFADWKRREQSKHYARIAEDFLIHDHANVWSRLRSQIDTTTRGEKPSPVRNKAGVLSVDDDSHVSAVKEHYEALAHDDPDHRSRGDFHYWDSIRFSYPRTEETHSSLNDAVTWHEVVTAIRSMNRDTAPGLDKMHVNLLKTLVREECMLAAFGTEKEDHPDNTLRSLPLKDFPEEPLSPMGKALWKVLSKTWALEHIPDGWNTVAICNLFKKGDPELLVNYRGLSLISVSLKVILIVMVHRLEKLIDSKKLSLSRCQSGFRKREEAISQFLVMAEIARRRHLNGLPTYSTFIDLVKAYDKVPHTGLFRVLEYRGIRGKFLSFIMNMYRSSKMTIRACGKLSEPFDMWRGLRQGCPLSPLLFIIYIDMFLVETHPVPPSAYVRPEDHPSRGVPVPIKLKRPGVDNALPPTSVYAGGGMYADDIVCFDEKLEDAQRRCVNIDKWGDKWGMYVNYSKSGVMLWSYDDEARRAFNEATFETPRGIYPKVDSYKYLGIEVTSDLPVFMGKSEEWILDGRDTNAMQFAKSQAAKGMEALSVLKPVLTDRACPIPLKGELIKAFVMSVMAYGSEFIGFNKKLAAPIQRVLDLAVRWSFGLRRSNTQTCSLNLSVELGLPMAYEFFAGQRARLFHKLTLSDECEKMQTLLPILQQRHSFAPQRVWCSETEIWLKRFHSAPSNKDKERTSERSGMSKYANFELVGNEKIRQRYSYQTEGGEPGFYKEAYRELCLEVEEWMLSYDRSVTAPPRGLTRFEVFDSFAFVNQESGVPYPVRGWYVFARMCELHRRSNSYTSKHLEFYRRMLLGVDLKGRILAPGTVLDAKEILLLLELVPDNDLAAANTTMKENMGAMPPWRSEDHLFERIEQELATAGGKSAGARRSFMREVRECALERLFTVDGGRYASFTDWYDKFQFGATRDYLRVTLGRPDLTRGVRWLALVRVGGFPRVFNARQKLGLLSLRHTCPLCGNRVELGADYIHLAMNCSFDAVKSARKEFLSQAIDYLLQDKVTKALFERSPEVPESVRGLSYTTFKTDQHSGLIILGVAIRLAGGCLLDPRESAFLLSFGQCDSILTTLDTFGYVSLASFLQAVAPLYCGAMGVDYRTGLELDSPVSSCLGLGGSVSSERSVRQELLTEAHAEGNAALSSSAKTVGRLSPLMSRQVTPVGRARYLVTNG